MRDTWPRLKKIAFPPIRRGRLDTLQVNIGYRCNQSCVHCHVNAGPKRTEEMSGEVIDTVLAFLARKRLPTLDITGGAPELNPHFRRLVSAARAMGVRVMDRCNLTVLEVTGQEDLAQFLARERVEIVASLPCYFEEIVDAAAAADARGRLQARARRTLRHCFQPALRARQHADSALRRDPHCQRRVRSLPRPAAARASRCQPRPGDVPKPDFGRLAGLYLRLRFQSDARSAAQTRRARAPAPVRSARSRDGGAADPGRRPLLRLHRRSGVELRRRAEGSGGEPSLIRFG